jgi:ADP-ribosylglycohydrolase
MIDRNWLCGGVYGLLLGDAAGVPYEFHPAKSLAPYADRIDMIPPAGFRRTYGVPVGTWSDDGALALCLLESLAERGGFDPVDQTRRMVAWLDEGHMAVDHLVFDVGNATFDALDQARSLLERGESPVGRGLAHEQSAGNGTLMRILPLALLHQGTDDDLASTAMEHSSLTHAHPLCQVCCAVYCLWARHLIEGREAPFVAAVAKVDALLRDRDEATRSALDLIQEWDHKTPTGSGFVVDTLYSARYALEAGRDFKDVVRRSILLGNDTDTTAAVAGGLAGLKFGFDALPADWMDLLRGKDLVEPILRKALAG